MPNTVNRALTTPNTGDMVGAWGTAAVNPNMQVIDGILAGVVSVALASTNVSLTISTGVIGTGSLTPGAGPVQADNAVVKLTGTLTGNPVVTFPCPGYWIVENNCTVGSNYIQLRAAGTGNVIGAPPGEAVHVYNDGTHFSFVDLGRVGSFLDLCVSTTPAWMTACTVAPYLPCVGTATYTVSVFPALGAMLGSTFGGNGITTFGVPDLGNRARVPLGGGRLTTATCGINGATWGAAGGDQAMQAHNHAATVTDPGHSHGLTNGTSVWRGVNGAFHPSGSGGSALTTLSVDSGTTSITVANATAGAGASGNVQPTLVFGVTFIRAG